jgi:hypothetical protein
MPRHIPPPKGNFKEWAGLLPKGEALNKFGRHIYIFRNIETNQILYTLRPRIEVGQANWLLEASIMPCANAD